MASSWKVIGALAVVATLTGAAFASAAMLNVASGSLQAGGAVVGGCQGEAPLTVEYHTRFDGAVGGFVVDSVMLVGLAQACLVAPGGVPHTMDLLLKNPGPSQCGVTPGPVQMGPIPVSCGRQPGPSQLPMAAAVEGVAVVIR